MPSREISVVIRRPPEVVFAYMNDVSREPEWQPQLRVAEQTPPGPTRVGSQRRYVSDFLGKPVENVYVVRAYEPNERLVLETTQDSALQATSDVRWEAVEGGTRVTMKAEGSPKGVLRFLPRTMVEAAFERELETALERLKERLERPA